uniref:SEA domain-containing protein n=1 Tax=Pseudo-nitzschia australis TaxID=44445 RepID=A0A7S4ACK6_9STRA|mmetsp:Transcript_18559/g.40398  ORF Transcript_18559/g.40398 Transcript_18559/m.40398 type:complete len:342 (-) Transcript_18559:15-1040(-)|eukprot:CAMPEP_0168185832 /NCGR_PEP_ID=MMETSP0139_2-20121125/14069_1 /TAXON_ID=44445 /ORGANISM="Pseudo-nitzschia australis, Strain 10249 10 AB" /LENGTH=341 /DNA_ID=CAMNT_0008107719 /DNA_START=59 /DNA_END=1084 /DNA_ORIENTATION=-
MVNTTFLFVAALVLGVSIDAAKAAESAPLLSIYKTPALLEIQFTSENQFSAEDIYHIEETATLYLHELLTNDDSLRFLEEEDSLIDVSVNVKTQEVKGNEISLGSEVDIVHYGEVGIADLAGLLKFLVNKNNTDSSFIYLDRMIETDASVQLISFDSISESIPMVPDLTNMSVYSELANARESKKKMLSFVTTLLSITLFGMSAILIWVGGGWLVLRKKVRTLLLREEEFTRMTFNIESKPTVETENGDEESPSKEKERTTPAKMGDDTYPDDVATPMSVMSDYSDTNRAPIGIMSMRKLVPSLQHRDGESESEGEGEDYQDENENEDVESGFDGMKKLEY